VEYLKLGEDGFEELCGPKHSIGSMGFMSFMVHYVVDAIC